LAAGNIQSVALVGVSQSRGESSVAAGRGLNPLDQGDRADDVEIVERHSHVSGGTVKCHGRLARPDTGIRKAGLAEYAVAGISAIISAGIVERNRTAGFVQQPIGNGVVGKYPRLVRGW